MGPSKRKEGDMKKCVCVCGALFLLVLVVLFPALAPAQQQAIKIKAKFIPPHINAVTQEYSSMAINLVLTGTNFPPKVVGDTWREIRLVPTDGGSDVYSAGQTGNWTSTRVDDLLHFTIPTARRYRVGLVQYTIPATARTLISNEVEIFLLMDLDHVTPNPVPPNATIVEVASSNLLGAQGAKQVKFGNKNAQVLEWGAAGPYANFKVRVPNSLARPGTYEIWVEENGTVVSRKIPVTLLAAPAKK
jgi:hypothetical protein